MVLEPGHQVLWWVVLPLLLLRSESKKTKMVARGPEWVGWPVRLLEALNSGALRVVGTLGVAKAAYVTTLPTDPESARIRWAQVSYVALEAG